MTMEDPLAMLRKYVINRWPVTMAGDKINFGNKYSLPGNVKTNYIVWGSGKNGTPKDYYDLKCLVFFLQMMNIQHSLYINETIKAKIKVVHRADRKDLLAYLNGEVSTTPSIDRYSSIGRLSDDGFVSHEQPRELCIIKKREADVELATPKDEKASKKRRLDHVCQSPNDIDSENDNIDDGISYEREYVFNFYSCNSSVRKKLSKQERKYVNVTSEMKNHIKKVDWHNNRISNRTKILQSTNNEFATSIFKTLKSIEVYESKENRMEQLSDCLAYSTKVSPPRLCRSTIDNGDKTEVQRRDKTGIREIVKPTESIAYKGIIIISGSNQSLITSANASDILGKLKFVPKEHRRMMESARKQKDLLIRRCGLNGELRSYRVVEDPLKLSVAEWQDVVAVFLDGTLWQFKKWPIYHGSPAETFSSIPAFYLKYDDVPLDKNIKQWDVTVININRTKEHWNRLALIQFWLTLDKEIEKKKELRF